MSNRSYSVRFGSEVHRAMQVTRDPRYHEVSCPVSMDVSLEVRDLPFSFPRAVRIRYFNLRGEGRFYPSPVISITNGPIVMEQSLLFDILFYQSTIYIFTRRVVARLSELTKTEVFKLTSAKLEVFLKDYCGHAFQPIYLEKNWVSDMPVFQFN